MDYGIIIAAVLALGGLGVIFAVGLAAANAKLAVKHDPTTQRILDALPGSNCGACGLGGCAGAAEAIARGEAPPDVCTPGGSETAEKIAEILGVEVEGKEPEYAVVHCNRTNCDERVEYRGLEDCRAAAMLDDSIYECRWACLGLGTCAEECPFDAIYMSDEGLPVIMEERCTGCGVCAKVCPKGIISVEKQSSFVHILCCSRDKGPVARKACERACIGCGRCAKVCPVDAIEIKDSLAHIDYEKCISCGKCVAECPTGAIGNYRKLRRRRADDA